MDWRGVESRESREALLRDLAESVEYWQETCVEPLESEIAGEPDIFEPEVAASLTHLRSALGPAEVEALTHVLGWALSGLTHSTLATLDGASAHCPTLDLRDTDGRSLGEALHEEWPDFDPMERRRSS